MKKAAIITGASNGIGKSIAEHFSGKRYQTVIADIDTGNGQILQTRLRKQNPNVLFVKCDVSDPVSIKKLIDKTVETFGRIDILINNAGVSEFIPPNELPVDEWDRILNTNLRSSFLLTRAAAKEMMKTGGGSVVNIASTRATMSEKNSEAYAASKGGLLALTHAMAVTWSDENITVNSISPGWIHSGDYENLRDIDHSQHPSGRVGKPEDIARACLYLTNPDNNFINGENLVIDGGMTRKMIYEH